MKINKNSKRRKWDEREILIKFEALIWFFSPVYCTDKKQMLKIYRLAGIKNAKLGEEIIQLLLKEEIIFQCHRILWVEKKRGLLFMNYFVDKGDFKISQL